MKKAVPAALGALLLVLAGCGGDEAPSSTEDGKKVVASITKAITAPDQGVSEADARCVATRFVDDQDVDPLVEAGVVGKDFAYDEDAVTDEPGSKPAKAFTAARDHCLENKVAASMAKVITTDDGLIRKASDGDCVAREFAHAAGLTRLIAGQAVTTQLEYVQNGAIQDAANAADYAAALEKCLDDKRVRSTLEKAVESAFQQGAAGGPTTTNVDCLVGDFVDAAGIEGLVTNRLVTDTGAFNVAGASYDVESATQLADAMLGCVDAFQAQARSSAAQDPDLDAAVLEACLKAAVPAAYLRDEFLVNQLLGRTAATRKAAATIQRASDTCERAQE